MDIIKANKGLQYRYRPPLKNTFNNKDISEVEGEPWPPKLSPKEEAKAQLAAAVATEAAAQVDNKDKEALAEELAKEATLEGDNKAGDKEDLSAADI